MATQTFSIDLSKYVETRLFGDRPHVRGRRIPVWVVAHQAKESKYSVSDLMYDFSLSEGEVLAALLYYIEHEESIEAQEAALDEEYRHFYEG